MAFDDEYYMKPFCRKVFLRKKNLKHVEITLLILKGPSFHGKLITTV